MMLPTLVKMLLGEEGCGYNFLNLLSSKYTKHAKDVQFLIVIFLYKFLVFAYILYLWVVNFVVLNIY